MEKEKPWKVLDSWGVINWGSDCSDSDADVEADQNTNNQRNGEDNGVQVEGTNEGAAAATEEAPGPSKSSATVGEANHAEEVVMRPDAEKSKQSEAGSTPATENALAEEPLPLIQTEFCCPFCPKAFKLQIKANYHMRTTHPEEFDIESSAGELPQALRMDWSVLPPLSPATSVKEEENVSEPERDQREPAMASDDDEVQFLMEIQGPVAQQGVQLQEGADPAPRGPGRPRKRSQSAGAKNRDSPTEFHDLVMVTRSSSGRLVRPNTWPYCPSTSTSGSGSGTKPKSSLKAQSGSCASAVAPKKKVTFREPCRQDRNVQVTDAMGQEPGTETGLAQPRGRSKSAGAIHSPTLPPFIPGLAPKKRGPGRPRKTPLPAPAAGLPLATATTSTAPQPAAGPALAPEPPKTNRIPFLKCGRLEFSSLPPPAARPESFRTCVWCGRVFAKQQGLSGHIRKHAPEGWVAKYPSKKKK